MLDLQELERKLDDALKTIYKKMLINISDGYTLEELKEYCNEVALIC
jgi:hypothetical protein